MSFNISVKFHKNNLDYDFTHICFLAVFMLSSVCKISLLVIRIIKLLLHVKFVRAKWYSYDYLLGGRNVTNRLRSLSNTLLLLFKPKPLFQEAYVSYLLMDLPLRIM